MRIFLALILTLGVFSCGDDESTSNLTLDAGDAAVEAAVASDTTTEAAGDAAMADVALEAAAADSALEAAADDASND